MATSINNPVPARIGEYTIMRKLGEGAMSNVYLAMHEGTFATVAIKQLKPGCRDAEHRKLLSSEVVLGKRMSHDNISRVLGDDLKHPDGAYLVMEYVDGVSLDHHDDPDNLLPLGKVLSVIRQAANALAHAAAQGVVHRDVKPANIILSKTGRAKLTDFGCAQQSGEKQHVVAGSLMYMSPEQIAGEPLDSRADMYSLGVVAYRLLAGCAPFEADSNFDLQTAVLHYQPRPLAGQRQGLPAELLALVNRAMRKNADERYQTWDQFISQLDRVTHQLAMNPLLELDADATRGLSKSAHLQYNASMISAEASRSRYSISSYSRSVMR